MPDLAQRLGRLFGAKHLRAAASGRALRAAAVWSRAGLSGRLVELTASSVSASAALTAAFGLVLDAQKHGEPVAWITALSSSFFPPDVAEGGVDLEALAVVRVPEPAFVPRAADKLARSGAFGLLVLDLFSPARSRPGPGVPSPLLSRLLGLAQRHDIAVVFLTCPRAGAPSLGSLISLRGEVRRAPSGPDRYQVEVQVLKDKRQAPGWAHTELCRGPVGLR